VGGGWGGQIKMGAGKKTHYKNFGKEKPALTTFSQERGKERAAHCRSSNRKRRGKSGMGMGSYADGEVAAIIL